MLRKPADERFEVWLVLFALYQTIVALGQLGLLGMFGLGVFFTEFAEQSSHGLSGAGWQLVPEVVVAGLSFVAIVVGLIFLLKRRRSTRIYWLAYLSCSILITLYSMSQNDLSCLAVVSLIISFVWLAYWSWSPHVQRLFPQEY